MYENCWSALEDDFRTFVLNIAVTEREAELAPVRFPPSALQWVLLKALRSGHHVIEAYREAALRSADGAVAFARAYRDLFEVSGESPRLAYFDESLIQALRNCVSQLSESDGSAVEWILEVIRA